MIDRDDHAPGRPATYRRSLGATVTVETQAAARATLTQAPDALVVVRRHWPRAVLFNCPDGCGDVLVINVDPSAGKAWRLREDPDDGVTLMPSVWRTGGCGAHFILWRNRVWWCRFVDDDTESSEDDHRDQQTQRAPAEEPWPVEMDAELRTEWQRIRAKWRRGG